MPSVLVADAAQLTYADRMHVVVVDDELDPVTAYYDVAMAAEPETAGNPRETQAAASDMWISVTVERGLAISVGIVTITTAVITFLAIWQEGSATQLDDQSVVESLLVQQRVAAAQARTHVDGSLAAEYRRMLAEADAVRTVNEEQAGSMEIIASTIPTLAELNRYLSDASASGRFNYDAEYQSVLQRGDTTSIPLNQPALTTALADRHHRYALRLAVAVAGMLGVIVLVTLARVVRTGAHRRWFVGVAGVAYLGFALAAVPW